MKSLTYREVRKRLKDSDPRFEEATNRGKGSHRTFSHPDINGEKRHVPVPCHGVGSPVSREVMKSIIRRFGLPKKFFD